MLTPQPVIAPHAPLTTAEVVAFAGWHPWYVRVIAELEAEHWFWREGSWQPGGSSGVGPLDAVGPLHPGGHADDSAWFAYGSAWRWLRLSGRLCNSMSDYERLADAL